MPDTKTIEDAAILRAAATILSKRIKRRTFAMQVVIAVLRNVATRLEGCDA